MSSTTPATTRGHEVATVQIKGKDYVTVAERVKLALRDEIGGYHIMSSDVLPLGASERLYVRVCIEVAGRTYYGSSELKLSAKPGTADGDSPLECAETSAVGRALGFAGIGLLDSIASADELRRNANVQNGRVETTHASHT